MSKPTKHIRRKKKYRLPMWIHRREFRLLNKSEKDFLRYLYSFGPDTCWLWNWRLAKEFGCTKRTIRYWLRKLRDLGFVWIEKPFGPQRKIHVRLLLTPEDWLKAMGTLALSNGLPKHKRLRRRPRGLPPPLSEWSSEAKIKQFRAAVINELVHRGETLETAEKVADQVIEKSRKKRTT